MTHQSRMLLIIAVFSVGGVSGLMYTANRYARILEQQPGSGSSGSAIRTVSAPAGQFRWKTEATARALARVDRFIGVRSRIHAEIERRNGALPGPGEFDGLRASVLAESGMTLDDYGGVREMYRSWRDGRMTESDVMAAAFEQRRSALERLDLGRYEELDS